MPGQPLESTPFVDKYYFLIRRLHSLTGLVPVGAFLSFHLFANASVLIPGSGGMEFQKAVERIHALGPLLIPVEIAFIFVPILFHAILGVVIWLTSKSNAQDYRFGPNIRYTLQRWTAWITLAFIVYHVWQLHWLGAPFGGGKFAAHDETGAATAVLTTATALQAAWWIGPVYFIGVLAAVFHLANGIWTLLITWGITIKPRTQQVSGYFCAVFGVVLFLAGMGALTGFKTFDLAAPPAGPTGHGVAVADDPH